MIPTSLTALGVFLVLMGPGYLYVRRIEQLEALYKVSPFRETVSIAMTSVFFNGIALLLFAILRVTVPTMTPDVGAIVRWDTQYLSENYAFIFWYASGLYLLAVLLALAVSHPSLRSLRLRLTHRVIGDHVLDSRSAWSRLFAVEPDTIVRVSCELDNGSWIDGWIYDWNAQPEEDGDRSLVLHWPVRVRAAGQTDPQYMDGIFFSVVAQGRIVRLDVLYVDAVNRSAFDVVYTDAAGTDDS